MRRVIAEARESKVWSIRMASPESTNLDVSIDMERMGIKERGGRGGTWIQWAAVLWREDLRKKRDLYRVRRL